MDTSAFDRALRKIPAIAVGTIEGTNDEIAGLGAATDEADPGSLNWEIGSVTKVFTGILLAEMSFRGEVALDNPIGRHLPDEVTDRLPAAEAQPTLSDLAAHTAGLPRIPPQWVKQLKNRADPYAHLTEHDVWDVLGPGTARPRRPRPRYSNFGTGLLGHLLGRAVGQPYAELVEERILSPLGMDGTTADGSVEPVQGYRRQKPAPSWTFGALAAAGSIRSTVSDMLAFARACIYPPEGALGAAIRLAGKPVWEGRIRAAALGWQIRAPGKPGEALWHNGGTYGGSSFLAVHTTRPVAIVSLGNAGPGLTSPLDGPSWKVFDNLA